MTTPAPAIRRSTIDRIPLHRRIFAPLPRRSMPRWLRRTLLGLLLLLLLIVALVACNESEKPVSLENSRLAGVRLTTGPVCIEEAVDVSGSMQEFIPQREHAEREMFAFAVRELTDDGDMFSAAFFAGSGVTAQAPAPLRTLTIAPTVPAGIDYHGTLLAPAVDALVASRAGAPGADGCSSRALVVITDGVIGDDEATLAASLRKGNYARIFAVVPVETGWGRPDQLQGGIRDSVSVMHFTSPGVSGRLASIFVDAKPIEIVFGEILGSLTGQRLEPIEQ